MSRPLVARIDTAALTHNLMLAKRLAGSAKVLAVVKANAYGHGLTRAAKALRAADGFAVLALEEAIALRSEGFSHPIIMLEGFFHPDELPEIARRRITPIIHREDQVDALARSKLEQKLNVFLKIDTGMHRLGITPKRLPGVLEKLAALPGIGTITLMTHFACADEEDVGVNAQLALFRETLATLPQLPGRLNVWPTSLANSAALMRYPETTGDWVRPGIMLYGASPFTNQSGEDVGLLPVMALESQLIATQMLRKGEGLGYGHTFIAPRDMKVGIVACGYADGYPRHATSGTPILVQGRLVSTLGRVSMDMLHVDLTEVHSAHVGSPVTLWGGSLPVEHVAAAAGTISYELLTGLAQRVRIEEV